MSINDTAISFEEFYKDAKHLKDQENFKGILDTLYTLKPKENRQVRVAIQNFIEFIEAEQTKPVEERASRDRYDEEFYLYAGAILPALFLRSLMLIRGLQMNVVSLKRKHADLKNNPANEYSFVQSLIQVSQSKTHRSLENLKKTFKSMMEMSKHNPKLLTIIKKYEVWLVHEMKKPIDDMFSKPELKLRYQNFYCQVSKYIEKGYLGFFREIKHNILLHIYTRRLKKHP